MSGAGRRRYPSRSAKAVTGSGFLPDHRPGVGLAGCPDSAGHHPAARDPLSGCDRSGFLASVASLGYPALPAVRSVLPGFRDPVSDCSGQPFALLKRASSRTSSKIDAISEDVFVADREAQPSSHRNDRIHRSVHSYCGRHHRLELPARIARVTTPPSRGRRRGSPGRDPRLRESMEQVRFPSHGHHQAMQSTGRLHRASPPVLRCPMLTRISIVPGRESRSMEAAMRAGRANLVRLSGGLCPAAAADSL